MNQLIEIEINATEEDDTSNDGPVQGNGKGKSKAASTTAEHTDDAGQAQEGSGACPASQYSAGSGGGGGPAYSEAASMEVFEEFQVPAGLAYQPRLTAMPALPGRLLAHLRVAATPAAAGAVLPALWWSTKVHELLNELEQIKRRDPTAKVVVFSSIKTAVAHVSVVLDAENVRHTKIVRGDTNSSQENAVHLFKTEESCRVLLLHAGVAAAGLTLTVARTVVLMEPFLMLGEELQAFNRCHRIGQTRNVRCVVLYAVGTVEERLLAYRRTEDRPPAADTNAAAAAAAEDGNGETVVDDTMSGQSDGDADGDEEGEICASERRGRTVGQLSVMADGQDSRGLSHAKIQYILGLNRG
jgi:hypothetical protein